MEKASENVATVVASSSTSTAATTQAVLAAVTTQSTHAQLSASANKSTADSSKAKKKKGKSVYKLVLDSPFALQWPSFSTEDEEQKCIDLLRSLFNECVEVNRNQSKRSQLHRAKRARDYAQRRRERAATTAAAATTSTTTTNAKESRKSTKHKKKTESTSKSKLVDNNSNLSMKKETMKNNTQRVSGKRKRRDDAAAATAAAAASAAAASNASSAAAITATNTAADSNTPLSSSHHNKSTLTIPMQNRRVICGINNVTKALERDEQILVLLACDVRPNSLAQHLLPLCASLQCIAVRFSTLSSIELGQLVGLRLTAVVGVRLRVQTTTITVKSDEIKEPAKNPAAADDVSRDEAPAKRHRTYAQQSSDAVQAKVANAALSAKTELKTETTTSARGDKTDSKLIDDDVRELHALLNSSVGVMRAAWLGHTPLQFTAMSVREQRPKETSSTSSTTHRKRKKGKKA